MPSALTIRVRSLILLQCVCVVCVLIFVFYDQMLHTGLNLFSKRVECCMHINIKHQSYLFQLINTDFCFTGGDFENQSQSSVNKRKPICLVKSIFENYKTFARAGT